MQEFSLSRLPWVVPIQALNEAPATMEELMQKRLRTPWDMDAPPLPRPSRIARPLELSNPDTPWFLRKLPGGSAAETKPSSELEKLDLTIQALYVRLRHYARKSAENQPGAEEKYQTLIARIRALQHSEAKLLIAERDQNSNWQPGRGYAAIEDAKRLIDAYAHLATPDPAADEPTS